MGRGTVMDTSELLERIKVLEYYQKLMFSMLGNNTYPFYRMIIEKGLKEEQITAFFRVCDELNKIWEEQKAEGFIHFHPLFQKFAESLPGSLKAKEVVEACIQQQLFRPFMQEMQKYLS